MPKTLLNPKYTLTGDSDWHLDDPVPLATCSSEPKPLRPALWAVVSFGGGMALVLGFQLLFGQHPARSAVPPSPQPPVSAPVDIEAPGPVHLSFEEETDETEPLQPGIVRAELDGNVVRELSLAQHFPVLVRFPAAIASFTNHNREGFSLKSERPGELVIEALVPPRPAPPSGSGAVWVELVSGETIVLHLSQVAPDEVVLGETTDVLLFTRPAAETPEDSQPAPEPVPVTNPAPAGPGAKR